MLSEEDIWNVFLSTRRQKTTTANENRSRCECAPPNVGQFIESEGREICVKCGHVCREIIMEQKHHYYNSESGKPNPKRTERINPLMPKSTIGSWAVRPKGRNVTLPSWFKRQHWGAIPGKERRQKQVFLQQEEIGQRMGIPKNVIEYAKILYKAISDFKIARMPSMRVTCLYYACKAANYPRDGNEFAQVTGYHTKQLIRSNKLFLQKLQKMKHKPNGLMTINQSKFESSRAEDFVNRYTYRLKLPFWLNEEIRLVIRNVRRTGIISNKSPVSLAATCIYFTALQYGFTDITQEHICQVFQISNATFYNPYTKLISHDYLLFLKDELFD